MSSLSLPFRLLLASTSAAGLTLLACGGDDSGSANVAASGSSDDKPDAAVHRDSGSAKADAGTSIIIPGIGSIPTGAVEGEECSSQYGMCDADACDSPPCGARCTDGVYQECKAASDLIAAAGGSKKGDAGKPPSTVTTDAGTFTVGDGSVSVRVGDASVTVPPTACPSPLKCSSAVSAGPATTIVLGLTGKAPYCSMDDMIGFPPSCPNSQADCTQAGLKLSSCVMGYCIQICK